MSRSHAAFFFGGFSESQEHIAPLADALAANLFPDIEAFTWDEAYQRRFVLAREAARRTVITHSAGAMFIGDARRVIALCGVEPTHPARSIIRAARVAFNPDLEREITIPRRRNVEHVLRHPIHLSVLARAATFSTLERLTEHGAEHFRDGRLYLPALHDEFGFGSPEAIARAQEHGITAAYVGRFHSDPINQPNATAMKIAELLEQSSTSQPALAVHHESELAVS